MKIAFRGHKSRGKEIIQIFKDLGTEDLTDHTGSCIDWVYFRDDSLRDKQLIVSTDITFLKGYGYKIYTLEEFEKEFPFKIGDEVTITGLPDFPKVITKMAWDCDEILYSFEGLNNTWFGAKSLKKFEMKEERNITLTLDKAKEWYKKGGELKEIALQAFTEQELNPLPRSWEEYCKQGNPIASWRYNIPTKYEALFKLEQLRDCWRQGWKPDWLDGNTKKYAIKSWRDKISIEITYVTSGFLSFPTYELAEEFIKCFIDLIEKAGDLI